MIPIRDWTGCGWQGVDDPRVRGALGNIDYFLRDLSRGIARIQNGEIPDGSGSPISGNPFAGTIGSVIFIGANTFLAEDNANFFWDDSNNRLGLGIATPAAILHLRQSSTAQTLRPSATFNGGGYTGQDGGATNQHNYINDQSDSTFLKNGVGGVLGCNLSAGTDPGVDTGHVLRARYRNATINATSINFALILYNGPGTTGLVATGTLATNVPVGSAWIDYTYNLTSGEAALITNYAALTFADSRGGFGGADEIEISEVWLELPGIATTDLARWDLSTTQVGRITVDGYLESRRLMLTGSTSGTITIQGGVTPASHSYTLPTAQGAASTLLSNDGAGALSWATIASLGLTNALLDGVNHTDTVAQGVSRGSLIYGNATPKWDELTIGAAGRVLTSNGTDVSWTALPAGATSFADNVFRVTGSADATKLLAFEVDGFATGTTRTLTPPNSSGTLALLEPTQQFTGINTWFSASNAFTGGTLTITNNAAADPHPWKIDEQSASSGPWIAWNIEDQALHIASPALQPPFKFYRSSTGITGFWGGFITAALSANRTYTLPNATGTVVLTAGAATLDAKTLTNAILTSGVISVAASTSFFQFQDSSDTTKKLQLNLAGQTTGITNVVAFEGTAARTHTFPNVTGKVPSTVFTQTADKTVANTTTETTIIGTGVGTLTLPANALIAGRSVRIKMSGIYSTVAITGGTLTIKVKYGSTVIATVATSSLLTGATNLFWDGEVMMTCRTTGATGTVMTSGRTGYQINATTHTVSWDELNNGGATTTIDTTAASALDVTVTWSAANASNTVTSLVSSVEVLN